MGLDNNNKLLEPNMRLGHYQVNQVLHEGANAHVYRAEHVSGKQPVILKVQHRQIASLEDTLRFRREFEYLSRLAGKGAPKVLGLERYQYTWLMIMEDDFAPTLSEWQTAKHGLKARLAVALALARSVEKVHACGLVHRDIKPKNILVLEDGKQVNLIDFGNATETAREQVQSALTGSLAYMSPE